MDLSQETAKIDQLMRFVFPRRPPLARAAAESSVASCASGITAAETKWRPASTRRSWRVWGERGAIYVHAMSSLCSTIETIGYKVGNSPQSATFLRSTCRSLFSKEQTFWNLVARAQCVNYYRVGVPSGIETFSYNDMGLFGTNGLGLSSPLYFRQNFEKYLAGNSNLIYGLYWLFLCTL